MTMMTPEMIETLAEAAHQIRISAYGQALIAPWAERSEAYKQSYRDIIIAIPSMLLEVGFGIVQILSGE